MRNIREKAETITVTKEAQINEEIVLEAGDKIRIVKENSIPDFGQPSDFDYFRTDWLAYHKDLTWLFSLETRGKARVIDVYYDNSIGNYSIHESSKSGKGGSASPGVPSKDQMIQKIVQNVYWSSVIDGIRFQNHRGEIISGQVALIGEGNNLKIISADDRRLKGNEDKVRFVNVELTYQGIMSAID